MRIVARWCSGSTIALVIAQVTAAGCGDDAMATSAGPGPASTAPPGTGPGSTTGASTQATTGASSTSDAGSDALSTSAGDETGETSSGGPTKFDLATPDGGGPGCDGGAGELLYSNIWIANSPQGTVSKIDTETMVELGRYYTDPSHGGDPSRTSVSLAGDVAVVNRAGSVTKIAGRLDRCVDKNDNGVIETSSGSDALLPFADDECILWTKTLLEKSRPAAWTSGVKVGEGCGAEYLDVKLWTSAPIGDNAIVYLIDGESGEFDGEVVVPGANGGLGIYGGAVDQDNDFWGVSYSAGPLVHVRVDDMSYETIPLPNPSAYGFTVDSAGRPWIGGWSGALQRYDPETQSWTTADTGDYSGLCRGMMEDQAGDLWIAGLDPSALLRVDAGAATLLEVLDGATLAGIDTPTGASVDYDGTVWMVDQKKSGGGAFAYEPETAEVHWIGGLIGPYTYSDMTGWALGNVADPQG